MKLTSGRNFTLILAAIAVVAMGIMAVSLNTKKKTTDETEIQNEIAEIVSQSSSDEVVDIEKDLMETDLSEIDKELQDIERELESIE